MSEPERVRNLLTLTLEHVRTGGPGHASHATSLSRLFGAVATGMGIYELQPGNASWPYHFEVTEEEWLIVIEGELTLRTPEGESVLRAGDVACFPAGAAAGMRCVTTRTRRALCDAFDRVRATAARLYLPRQREDPRRRPGLRPPRLDRRAGRLLGGRAVSVVNLFEVELKKDEDDAPGYDVRYVRVGPVVAGDQLGLSVYELVPGQSICPYHFENAEEEWLIVLVGRPTLRTPEGERGSSPWDCAFFPTGEAGAHKVTNRTDETVRVCIWSNRIAVATSVYPDSEKVGAWPPGQLFRLADAVDYFSGEA